MLLMQQLMSALLEIIAQPEALRRSNVPQDPTQMQYSRLSVLHVLQAPIKTQADRHHALAVFQLVHLLIQLNGTVQRAQFYQRSAHMVNTSPWMLLLAQHALQVNTAGLATMLHTASLMISMVTLLQTPVIMERWILATMIKDIDANQVHIPPNLPILATSLYRLVVWPSTITMAQLCVVMSLVRMVLSQLALKELGSPLSMDWSARIA